MNKLTKSILRHLLGAILAAVGAVLATGGGMTWAALGTAVAAAAIPVLIKALDPGEKDYGVGSAIAAPTGD